MSRPRQQRRPPRKQLPHRINDAIRSAEVRLIDENDEQLGVMPTSEAFALAAKADLDLVEIAPKAKPPVCRLLVYSKFLYDYNRKEKAAQKGKQKPPHEIRMGPSIGEHDYETKRRQSEKFLIKGGKVKLVVQLRKRENAHPDIGVKLLNRFRDELPANEDANVSQAGNRISVVLSPDKTKVERLQQTVDDSSVPDEPVIDTISSVTPSAETD